MIRKMLEFMVKKPENDEIVEEGFFIFEGSKDDSSIMVPYKLREGEDFEKERDKVAMMINNKSEIN